MTGKFRNPRLLVSSNWLSRATSVGGIRRGSSAKGFKGLAETVDPEMIGLDSEQLEEAEAGDALTISEVPEGLDEVEGFLDLSSLEGRQKNGAVVSWSEPDSGKVLSMWVVGGLGALVLGATIYLYARNQKTLVVFWYQSAMIVRPRCEET